LTNSNGFSVGIRATSGRDVGRVLSEAEHAMQFRPRFPLSEVGYWADRYQYADDVEVEAIGNAAGRRGSYTRNEFLDVARWKTRGRSARFCEMNSDAEVRRATALALATSDERERVAALLRLHGVQMPTASVLLHLALPDRFPIIDYRALWSLGVDDGPASYSFDFWWPYVEACRSLRIEAKVGMRRLDRGLWQFSKEHQAARGSTSAGAAARPQRRPKDTLAAEAMREGVMIGNFNVEAYGRVVTAAIEGHTIPYSALPGSRRNWGSDLFRIADYEKAHGRPPLTAIVVHKQDGRPGKGFAIAVEQVGYARRPGESDEDLWKRALRDVFAYWRP
jgi:hypothetical protein